MRLATIQPSPDAGELPLETPRAERATERAAPEPSPRPEVTLTGGPIVTTVRRVCGRLAVDYELALTGGAAADREVAEVTHVAGTVRTARPFYRTRSLRLRVDGVPVDEGSVVVLVRSGRALALRAAAVALSPTLGVIEVEPDRWLRLALRHGFAPVRGGRVRGEASPLSSLLTALLGDPARRAELVGNLTASWRFEARRGGGERVPAGLGLQQGVRVQARPDGELDVWLPEPGLELVVSVEVQDAFGARAVVTRRLAGAVGLLCCGGGQESG